MEQLHKLWDFTLFSFGEGVEITFGRAVTVAVIMSLALALAKYLSRLLARQMHRGNVDPNAIQTIVRLFYWVFIILSAITALAMLEIPVAQLAFISGGLAIGVGFGAQSIINNLISSWILMSEKPVRIGDFVEIDQHMGVVERIGNRSTRIRRVDGVHVLVPNSQMLERVVVNWTLVDYRFRASVRVGVAYGSPVERVTELIHEAAMAEREVLAEPKPVVIFEDFGESAMIFDLYFWCDISSGGELRAIRSSVRFNIERLFRENGIVIAYPQRNVHLDTSRPLDVRLQAPEPIAKDV
jgi:small-conductance mechanosensitive channel